MKFITFLEVTNRTVNQAVTMVLDPDSDKDQKYIIVKVNMEKLIRMTPVLSKGQFTKLTDSHFGNKLERFAKFAETTKEPIRAPYQTGSMMDENNITLEGNHRLAYFYKKGVKIINIAIRESELEAAKKIPNFLVNFHEI